MKPDVHYCLITNLSGVVRYKKYTNRKHYICRKCLWSYTSQGRLEAHKMYCYHKAQRVVMPEPEEAVYQFGLRSQSKTERAAFLIVADFESLLIPENNPSSPRLNKHVPLCICLQSGVYYTAVL